jgi:hypothetical protein
MQQQTETSDTLDLLRRLHAPTHNCNVPGRHGQLGVCELAPDNAMSVSCGRSQRPCTWNCDMFSSFFTPVCAPRQLH